MPELFLQSYPCVLPKLVKIYKDSIHPKITEATLSLIDKIANSTDIWKDDKILKDMNFTGLETSYDFVVKKIK
jgi:hypothetical protein